MEEAEQVEERIEELAENLRKMAVEIGVHDHRHAAGITLMQKIYEHFGNKAPPFPMYAYTSKGPFLLEQKEWENISKYGAEILLKNRVTADGERTEIEGDVILYRKNRRSIRLVNSITKITIVVIVLILSVIVIGRWIRGTW